MLYEIDYLGEMTLQEIKTPGNGFTKHQKQAIANLAEGETTELIDSNMTFNVRRLK